MRIREDTLKLVIPFQQKKQTISSVFSYVSRIEDRLADDQEYFEQMQTTLARINHKSVVGVFGFYKKAFNKESGLLDSLNEKQKKYYQIA